jgi:mannitol operon repressor
VENPKDNSEMFIQLTEELKSETDRAAALLSAAYIDHLLAKLLETMVVVDGSGIRDNLFNGSSAPLATFSSRILVSFAFGLISEEEKIEINLIRKIRNKFAHQLMGLSFETEEIRSLVKNLKSGQLGEAPRNSRDIFLKAAVRQIVEIIIKLNSREGGNVQSEE